MIHHISLDVIIKEDNNAAGLIFVVNNLAKIEFTYLI